MADVYLGAACGPAGFSKLLVIKALQPSLARRHDLVAMFRDEARLAARLNHPNIVQTYGVGQCEGTHFIAMEYLEGQPLHRVADALQRRGELSLGVVLRIAMDTLEGLHYAHELPGFDGRPLGVVHRDVTPHNIFVTYEGQIKVVDFGIAKALDSSTQTDTGSIKGKVAYMAPEQARGERVTRTADVYSVGVVLWELLSGRRMWAGLTDVAVIARLTQGQIPHLSTLRRDLPPSLTATVMKALDPDPASRYQTAAAFQRDVELEFERLETRLTHRKLGEIVRHEFREERAETRSIVARQVERLVRSTPTAATTPPGCLGWNTIAGEVPLLGDGGHVHNEPTTLTTGLTGPGGFMVPMGLSRLAPAATTSVTDPGVLAHSRKVMWVAMVAVALAGIVLGIGVAVGATQARFPWAQRVAAALGGGAPLPPTAHAASAERGSPARPLLEAAAMPSDARCDGENKPIVELNGEIAEQAVLTCDKDYLLRYTTYVRAGATLTIQAGTRILGDLDTRGVLVVQPGGRIQAVGTPERPIVLTSAAPPGKRKPGDWGGLIILGRAPTNLKDARGRSIEGQIEGITAGGRYGGNNPNDSSGILRYVRIEYSGTEIAPNNEINGLTLGAVGRGTVIDHVQVRHPADDCFEFFGGTVDAKYLICQQPDDDAFDWDYGYTGRLQFLVSQASPKVAGGSNGFEGDNDPNGSTRTPISQPQIYNVTVCGKNRQMTHREHYGMLLRRGSRVTLRNGIFVGFGAGLEVRDARTKPDIGASLFFGNIVHNLAYPRAEVTRGVRPPGEQEDSPESEVVDARAHLRSPARHNVEADPQLGGCFDLAAPSFKPMTALTTHAATPPDDGFFDTSARYVGAFRDRDDAWDQGAWVRWTD